MWIVVDFPAPLGPRRPVTPAGMSTVTSLRAMTGPYQREARAKEMDAETFT
jgi:hypothetical protein